MTEPTVVLVTGVSSFWGARVATQLLAHGLHVIGLDAEPLLKDAGLSGKPQVMRPSRTNAVKAPKYLCASSACRAETGSA